MHESLFLKLVRVMNLTARPFAQTVGRQHHITLNEWRLMALMAGRPDTTAGALAELSGLDKMAVSRALEGLHRHQRLERSTDPADQRRQRLRLSAQGRHLHAHIAPLAHAREQQLLAGLSASDQQQLERLLDRLAAGLETSPPGNPTG